jgi:hypothetical protein
MKIRNKEGGSYFERRGTRGGLDHRGQQYPALVRGSPRDLIEGFLSQYTERHRKGIIINVALTGTGREEWRQVVDWELAVTKPRSRSGIIR